LRPVALL